MWATASMLKQVADGTLYLEKRRLDDACGVYRRDLRRRRRTRKGEAVGSFLKFLVRRLDLIYTYSTTSWLLRSYY